MSNGDILGEGETLEWNDRKYIPSYMQIGSRGITDQDNVFR